jgi:hypothetical protein
MPSDPRDLTVEQYKAAFLELEPELMAKQRELLQAHYAAPGHKATYSDLARAVGWFRYSAVSLHYGRLARKIGEMYGLRLPEIWVWGGMLASFEHPARQWEFTLRPQVVQALEELGWVSGDPLADVD